MTLSTQGVLNSLEVTFLDMLKFEIFHLTSQYYAMEDTLIELIANKQN